MKYDYKKIIEDNRTINSHVIKELNDLYKKYPNLKLVIEISSTKYLSSELIRQFPKNIIIRVVGGYDQERVERNKNKKYKDGETGAFYEEAVIYTRDELAEIVQEFEIIEAGYNPNWSPLQKIVYVYDRLKREIMYDPENETKKAREISSLRGIITKQTVCAGYALIFKELMDRAGIECEYVEGYTKKDHTGAHAWNIVNLDGKKYPIDLTKDNAWFRVGKIYALDSFSDDTKTFAEIHIPNKNEKTQNYEETLSQFDPEVIKEIIEEINKSREYRNTTYYGTRKDGSRFIINCIGNAMLYGTPYFRYYYEGILPDGKRTPPVIFYSENNIIALVYDKLFKKKIPAGYEYDVNNVLFSKENILDSLNKKSFYLGKVYEHDKSEKGITKPDELLKVFSMPSKIYEREDGTTFIVQKTPQKPHKINGVTIYAYNVLETVTKNNKELVKSNIVYTEKEFLSINPSIIANKFLTRAKIDAVSKELGGYLGYCEEDGEMKYTPEVLSYFRSETNKNISQNKNTKKR